MLFLLRGSAQNQTAEPYDILISEFMADPTPVERLPNAEYIELYNRSSKTIKLGGFKIVNGDKHSSNFPDIDFKPKSFIIVHERKSTANFKPFGDTIQLTKLPTLSNPNDIFHLISKENIVIDAASYDLSYYQSSSKAQGGWSLERINFNISCTLNNWVASKDSSGGTPGKKNSIYQDTVDKTAPQLILAYTDGNKKVVLNFDKSLDRKLTTEISHFSIDNDIKINNLKILDTVFYKNYQINLKDSLKKKIPYKLILKTTLKDCMGIPLSKSDTIILQLPETPKRNDLIINELLINPEVGGSRFVEIYNRSMNVIDLFDITVEETTKRDIKAITSHYPLFPKKYVVLTENPDYILKRYNAYMYKKAIIKNRLPSWSDLRGNVSLYENKSLIIDNFNYNKSFHNPLLANTEGVSLERINPNESTNSAANWHSAAASVLYATPAYQNSQLSTTPSVSSNNEEIFTLLNKTFSPNDDGFQDYLLMHYSIDKKGYLANISIYDIEGRLVKRLTINELLSTEGQFKWDGETEEKLVAPVGTYIIYIELINPDGSMKKFKKLCVLADKF